MYFFITQAQNPDITNDKFLLNDDLQSWVRSIAMVDMFMTDGHWDPHHVGKDPNGQDQEPLG